MITHGILLKRTYPFGEKTSSSHNILRFIAAPARLEFLTALAIKSKLPAVEVIPNYPCDDEGLPTSTAGGDIEILSVSRLLTVYWWKSQCLKGVSRQ